MQPGNTCRQGPRKPASGPIPSLAHTLRDADLKTKILDYKPVTNFMVLGQTHIQSWSSWNFSVLSESYPRTPWDAFASMSRQTVL
jgi:hypothetical protein